MGNPQLTGFAPRSGLIQQHQRCLGLQGQGQRLCLAQVQPRSEIGGNRSNEGNNVEPPVCKCLLQVFPGPGVGVVTEFQPNARGMVTEPSCSRSKGSRPRLARLESGEVLLTTSIKEVSIQIVETVLTRDAALTQFDPKSIAIQLGHTSGLPK